MKLHHLRLSWFQLISNQSQNLDSAYQNHQTHHQYQMFVVVVVTLQVMDRVQFLATFSKATLSLNNNEKDFLNLIVKASCSYRLIKVEAVVLQEVRVRMGDMLWYQREVD